MALSNEVRRVFPERWRLRSYQEPAWDAWRAGKTRSLLLWHRRAGKDEYALYKAAIAGQERVGNYWHCLPQYEQARKAIWEAINPRTGQKRIDEAFPRYMRKRTDNQQMVIEFNPPNGSTSGSIWRVVGSDNPDSLVGAPPVGIVFSEWALSNPSAWAYLAPILAENEGWADFITTPRGRNHVYEMYRNFGKLDDWFVQRLTIEDTGFPLKIVEAQRNEYHGLYGRDAGNALIDQEYYCSFEAAILGAYWGKELADVENEGRIVTLKPKKGIPIDCAWDLGKGANMSVWAYQAQTDRLNILGHVKGFGIGIPSMVEQLEELGFKGGTDWVPHDARVPELGSERTRVETLIELKRKPRVVMNHRKIDGINAVRQCLPLCWFDDEGTREGLEALRQYRAEWNDDKKMYGDVEVHDWTSHPADAFRYLCMAWRNPIPKDKEKDALKELMRNKSLNELLEEYDAEQEGD